ncbi:/ / HNH endonuclease / 377955:378221 Reverse [Candidatus Hepatoplasma crinochetorum]|uniref:/ / HNH endonuclease / 377955:378221 Reverse n=1 Tax=Candidatus Hepatoplasma crinochetorum TaxID=295596 RepID=A0A0G7ZMU5_9MOLU|nr:/ / HNH endonuclease / 377955:378221 Reverse [Candidatus Hepatoplasma crinochetorum]
MERIKFTINDRKQVWNSDPKCTGKKSCKDQFGRMIKEDHYNRRSQYGWTIDHVIPIARDGTNDLSNLQPLHWQSNLDKNDSPHFSKRI